MSRDSYFGEDVKDTRMIARFGLGVVLVETAVIIKDLFYGRWNKTAAVGDDASDAELSADGQKAFGAHGRDDTLTLPELLDTPNGGESEQATQTSEAEPQATLNFPLASSRAVAMLEWGDGFVPIRLGPGSGDRGLSLSAAGNDNFEGGKSIALPFGPRLPAFDGAGGGQDGDSGGSEEPSTGARDTSDGHPPVVDGSSPTPTGGGTVAAGDGTSAGGAGTPVRDERTNPSQLASGQTITLRALVGNAVLIAAADILQFIRDEGLAPLSFGDGAASEGNAQVVSNGEQTSGALVEAAGAATTSDETSDDVSGSDQSATIALAPHVDAIYADDGDSFSGAPESDAHTAGMGDRLSLGGEGRNMVDGDLSTDGIVGSAGDDILVGGDGNDSIFGQAGNDALFGGAGNDYLDGGAGDDHLDGGSGRDVLVGGSGNDILNGGTDSDVVLGGDGDDTIVESDTESPDHFDGGEGFDTLDLSDADRGVVVDLNHGTVIFDAPEQRPDVQNHAPNGDVVKSDPDLADTTETAPVPEVVADTIDMTLVTEVLADTIDTTPVIEVVADTTETIPVSEVVADTTDVNGRVTDTVINVEGVVGTKFADVLIGNADDNKFDGGNGDDVLVDGEGIDTLHGGEGDDTLLVTNDLDSDTFDGGEGRDTLVLSEFQDGVILDLEQQTLERLDTPPDAEVGPVSDPVVDRVFDFEVFVLGDGEDIVIAGEGQADYWGGRGNDIFRFNDADTCGNGEGLRDRIMDFEPGDKIDLRDFFQTLGEDTELQIDDAQMKKFVMIRDTDEFTKPGQLRLVYDTDEDGQKIAVLQGNIDNVGDVDFEIELRGYLELNEDQLM